VAPKWLSDAFVGRLNSFVKFEFGSLDEAFGHRPPTSRTRQALADRVALIPELSRRLVRALFDNPTAAINTLIEEVGRQLGMSKTVAEDYYWEGVREHGFQNLTDLKQFLAQRRPAETTNSPGRRRRR
jgi:hypothetical protein